MVLSKACPRALLAVTLFCIPVVTLPEVALAQGVGIETATDAQKKEAQSHYERGAKAFDQKRFEEAFNAFAASYGVVKSPNAHMMMARALMGLGRNVRAYNELYVAEQESQGNPKYATTLERCKELRAEAGQKVAVVNIKLVGEKSGPVRITAGNELLPVERPYALEPGKLTIKAFVSDQQKDVKEVDVPAGKEQPVELTVGPLPQPGMPAQPIAPTVAPPSNQPPPVVPAKEEPEEPRSPAATGLLIGGTVVSLLGLGGMAVGAGLYFAAKEDHDFLSDPENGCHAEGEQTVCPESYQDRIDSGQDNQKAAGIAVGVGGAVTAIGIGMLIGGGVLAGAPKDRSGKAAPVRIGVGPTSLWIEGEY
jgi:hypothetical protein